MTASPKVLIVEPNPFMAEVEQAILKAYRIEFVAPQDLVSKVEAERPALVITEILLPGEDGLQLCRRLKGDPNGYSVPVILFSVLNAKEDAVDVGADGFLLKPAERGGLLAEVRRLTGGP